MARPSSKQTGFSLVELSIVLVILGLLVGGILAGQSLIRASELRAVSTEYNRYNTAISAFRDKYFAIPGDFANASGFGWGSYNGNGNGQLDLSTTAGSNESSTIWVQLAAAGLIEGSYTNVAATSTSVCGTMTAGTNNPRSKMNSAGWNALYLGAVDITSLIYYQGSYGNVFVFGGGTTCGTATATTGLLKSEEAWNIDTKMDDGKPDSGAWRTFESQGNATSGSGCGTIAPAATALAASSYDLANTSATACSFVIKTGY